MNAWVEASHQASGMETLHALHNSVHNSHKIQHLVLVLQNLLKKISWILKNN